MSQMTTDDIKNGNTFFYYHLLVSTMRIYGIQTNTQCTVRTYVVGIWNFSCVSLVNKVVGSAGASLPFCVDYSPCL